MTRACFLFDLDGTLCETDTLHYEAFLHMLRRFNRPISREEYNQKIMGYGSADIFGYLFPGMPSDEYDALVEEKERYFRDHLDELPLLPGVTKLLDAADRHAMPYRVVTNAPRDSGSLQLEKLGLAARMGEPVYGLELERAKPDPLPYLTGLRSLGGDAARTVAFEDSRSGMQAAIGAGLAVVGLATTLSEKQLMEAGAALAVPNYLDPRLWDFLSHKLRWSVI
jgi:HAD superfamily hydrolase (TIGR01509 family)